MLWKAPLRETGCTDELVLPFKITDDFLSLLLSKWINQWAAACLWWERSEKNDHDQSGAALTQITTLRYNSKKTSVTSDCAGGWKTEMFLDSEHWDVESLQQQQHQLSACSHLLKNVVCSIKASAQVDVGFLQLASIAFVMGTEPHRNKIVMHWFTTTYL